MFFAISRNLWNSGLLIYECKYKLTAARNKIEMRQLIKLTF